MLISILLGLLLIWPTGGSYRRLARAEVRWSGAFVSGAVLQFAVLPLLPDRVAGAMPTIAWLTGGALLIVGCLANREVRGFLIAAMGVGLNFLVIAANAGMPVYSGALEAAGAGSEFSIELGTIYRLADEGTRLLVLADVVPVPGSPPIRSIGSLGDLLLCIGVIVVLLQLASAPNSD